MAKNVRVTTPVGIARWPFLNRPSTKFEPVYKVDLVLPVKEAKGLIEKIKAVHNDAFKSSKLKKKATLPFEKELDDEGKETGNIVFKCKSKVRESFDPKPVLFDAKGNKVDVKVGGGTKLKLNLELYTWEAQALGVGITLQPRAAQIIELVEYEAGGSADSYGFDEEEGFEADDVDEEPAEGRDEPESDEESDEDLF